MNLSKRKNIRLQNYDYSQNGYYFITICTHDRQNLFGSIAVGQGLCPTAMDIVCTYKSITTKLCNKTDDVAGRKIWQTRFHDHIIRNEDEYKKIWQYIVLR